MLVPEQDGVDIDFTNWRNDPAEVPIRQRTFVTEVGETFVFPEIRVAGVWVAFEGYVDQTVVTNQGSPIPGIPVSHITVIFPQLSYLTLVM